MSDPAQQRGSGGGWRAPAAAFAVVAVVQWWLVTRAGSDIPFQDQWDLEGRWLYPAWREGTLSFLDLFRAHNEHRIVWTHLLNLALFAVNGQWDPLVQQAAGAILHGLGAAALVALLRRAADRSGQWLLMAGVALAFLPFLGWHNALWGFQSHAYFAVLFSLPALGWLAAGTTRSTLAGAVAAVAALLAMGAGALVPAAVLGLLILQALEHRRIDRAAWPQLLLVAGLLVAGWCLRTEVPEHRVLQAASFAQFFGAAGRLLAWPHVDQPLAALVLNLPLVVIVAGRLSRRRQPAPGENLAVLIGLWSGLVALAAAWSRGGSAEFAAGVPSRYADFIVLLPLANAWCAVQLAREAAARRRVVRVAGLAWGVFLLVGWFGLSAQMWRGVIGPRLRDRAAPERLAREFQLTRNPAVFAGQPRLLVPHPDLGSVTAVLDDPRLAGALPPSLQPERPPGPLSRLVRGWPGRQ